jgi:hypothetical protein
MYSSSLARVSSLEVVTEPSMSTLRSLSACSVEEEEAEIGNRVGTWRRAEDVQALLE